MKGNQNNPNKQVTSIIMTGKPLPFPYRSRSNSRYHLDISRHRRPNNYSQSNSKTCYGNINFKPPSRIGSPYPRPSNSQNKPTYNNNNNNNNTYSNNSRQQSPHYNRNGDCSRRPFSRNRLRNVRNCINSLLDQKQTENKMSSTEHTELQKASQEQILEQQLNDLLLDLNQDTQDALFNCQEEYNTLTEE